MRVTYRLAGNREEKRERAPRVRFRIDNPSSRPDTCDEGAHCSETTHEPMIRESDSSLPEKRISISAEKQCLGDDAAESEHEQCYYEQEMLLQLIMDRLRLYWSMKSLWRPRTLPRTG